MLIIKQQTQHKKIAKLFVEKRNRMKTKINRKRECLMNLGGLQQLNKLI